MNTTPVYSGKVVDAIGRDRLGIFVKYTWRADRANERKAAKEAAGDTITFVSKPRDARPGEVPAATAKTIQQERAEKVAAKIASKNQQRGTKREATKAKRAEKAKPVVQTKPKPAPKPVKKKRAKRTYVRQVQAPEARAVVCITTGKYYPTLAQAQASVKVGPDNRALAQSLNKNGGLTRYRSRIYAYATDQEKAALACLRKIRDVQLPKQASGNPAIAKPMLLIDTGMIYETVSAIAAAAHVSRRRFIHMEPGEIRHTPAGAIRRATEQEIQQWKQAQGGQMQIAFNTSR